MQTSTDVIIFFVMMTCFFIFLVLLVMGMLYVYKKKQLHHHIELEAVQLKAEKHILSSRMEIQENALQSSSREIHDNINLSLTLAKLHLNSFSWENSEKAKMQLDDSISILSQSISDLRDIAKGMNPGMIERQGLIVSVEQEIERIRRAAAFDIDFAVTGERVYMQGQKELIIFRVIQECFNNIIRHSHATNAWVVFTFTDLSLAMVIGDNGAGFAINAEQAVISGSGLVNMQSRIELLGGEMAIKSGIGRGTLIEINIPLKSIMIEEEVIDAENGSGL